MEQTTQPKAKYYNGIFGIVSGEILCLNITRKGIIRIKKNNTRKKK